MYALTVGARVAESPRPSRQRRLATIVLLAAAALAAAATPFAGTWWGGWILAVAEAGIVGGLADWFAVTALFRRPLGLPIPHTAIISANWERLADRVGTMVGDRVLSKEYVAREIARVDVAGLLAKLAERLTPADLEATVRGVARWGARQIPPAASDVGPWLTRLARAHPIAPLLATGIDVARRHGWDQRSIETVAIALVDALDRPEFRKSVGDLVDDVLAGYRARMSLYPRFLMGLANTFGLVDRERVIAALREALERLAADPGGLLRARLIATLASLPERLRTDPALAARIEAAKEELLASPAVARLVGDVAAYVREALAADLAAESSEGVAWIAERLDRARLALAGDEELRRAVDRRLKEQVTDALDRHHALIARFIQRGVRELGVEGTVHLLEEHAGEDLQYIRINGTVVGGLAGGALYGIHLLLRLAG